MGPCWLIQRNRLELRQKTRLDPVPTDSSLCIRPAALDDPIATLTLVYVSLQIYLDFCYQLDGHTDDIIQ